MVFGESNVVCDASGDTSLLLQLERVYYSLEEDGPTFFSPAGRASRPSLLLFLSLQGLKLTEGKRGSSSSS